MATVSLQSTQGLIGGRAGLCAPLAAKRGFNELSTHLLLCALLVALNEGLHDHPARQVVPLTPSLELGVGAARSVSVRAASGTRTAPNNFLHEGRKKSGQPVTDQTAIGENMDKITDQLHQFCEQAVTFERVLESNKQSDVFGGLQDSLSKLCLWHFKSRSTTKQKVQPGGIRELADLQKTSERRLMSGFFVWRISIFIFLLGFSMCPSRRKILRTMFAGKYCSLSGSTDFFSSNPMVYNEDEDPPTLLECFQFLFAGGLYTVFRLILYRVCPGTAESLFELEDEDVDHCHNGNDLPDEKPKQPTTQESSVQTANLPPRPENDEPVCPPAADLSNVLPSAGPLPVNSCSCNVPPSSDFHNNNIEEIVAATTDEDITTGAKQQMQAIVRVKMENRPYQRLVKVSLSSDINSTLAEPTPQSPNEQVFTLPLSTSGTVNIRLHSDDLLDGVTGSAVEQRHLVRLFGQVVNIVTDVDYSAGKASGFFCIQIATESDILHKTIKVDI